MKEAVDCKGADPAAIQPPKGEKLNKLPLAAMPGTVCLKNLGIDRAL